VLSISPPPPERLYRIDYKSAAKALQIYYKARQGLGPAVRPGLRDQKERAPKVRHKNQASGKAGGH
jgi:hypothetical protein